MILVDAHEDLAYNTLVFQRDYTQSAFETRRLESGTPVTEHNGDTLLGWPEYQRGQVAVIFSTLLCHTRPPARGRVGLDVLHRYIRSQ